MALAHFLDEHNDLLDVLDALYPRQRGRAEFVADTSLALLERGSASPIADAAAELVKILHCALGRLATGPL
ncbi:hypothetical protein [Rhodococcus sp. APC 3903]|uniref:hypothetical protein n=1 Tax=Rhodococcus sp. APC 3903 TaxID=3035193 RepID=UPI0025B2EEDE|nr:hypothetical protein [Rhodococcus sp. APC 3903]MDN3461013.1 hypothetical protein [Rhodococcus sp. APC 3903]